MEDKIGIGSRLRAVRSTHIHPKDLSSLEAFLEDYPEANGVFLYRGTEKVLLKDKILCMPCEEFLAQLIQISVLSIRKVLKFKGPLKSE